MDLEEDHLKKHPDIKNHLDDNDDIGVNNINRGKMAKHLDNIGVIRKN